jgi:hypothetical protein
MTLTWYAGSSTEMLTHILIDVGGAVVDAL